MANWNLGHDHFPMNVGVQCGCTDTVTVSHDGYKDVPVTFGAEFYAAPIVVVGFVSGSVANEFGKCAVAITGAVTTTGFTARIYNSDATDRKPQINWIAVGTPK